MNQPTVLKPDIKSAMFPRIVFTVILGGIIGAAITYFFSALIGITAVTIILSFNLLSYFNLKSREYRFKPSQIEVYEGFLNIKQDNVSYTRITDITLNKPVIQRVFGTGSIKINTAGSDHKEINIGYIRNPEEEFQRIKEITKN